MKVCKDMYRETPCTPFQSNPVLIIYSTTVYIETNKLALVQFIEFIHFH